MKPYLSVKTIQGLSYISFRVLEIEATWGN